MDNAFLVVISIIGTVGLVWGIGMLIVFAWDDMAWRLMWWPWGRRRQRPDLG